MFFLGERPGSAVLVWLGSFFFWAILEELGWWTLQPQTPKSQGVRCSKFQASTTTSNRDSLLWAANVYPSPKRICKLFAPSIPHLMVCDIPHFLHFTSVPAKIEKVMSLHFDDDLLAITIVLGTRKPIVRPGFPVIGLFHVFTLKSQPGPACYSDISYIYISIFIYIYISWHN